MDARSSRLFIYNLAHGQLTHPSTDADRPVTRRSGRIPTSTRAGPTARHGIWLHRVFRENKLEPRVSYDPLLTASSPATHETRFSGAERLRWHGGQAEATLDCLCLPFTQSTVTVKTAVWCQPPPPSRLASTARDATSGIL